MLNREAVLAGKPRPFRGGHRIETIQRIGQEHEQAYIDHLRSHGLSVVDLDNVKGSSDAPTRTIEAMASGADVITQAGLVDGVWNGRADVLRKVDAPGTTSNFGPWAYEVYDTKLSAETKGGTILQLCLYSDMLAKMQGSQPAYMYVVPPSEGYEAEAYRFDDFAAYYRYVRKQLFAAVNGDGAAEDTYPYPVPHCDVCNWWETCLKRRRNDDHLSLVAGCSRLHIRTLEDEGIRTLEALATLDTGTLGDTLDGTLDDTLGGTPPPSLPFRPKRGAPQTYLNLRHQARLQLEEREANEPRWAFRDDVENGDGLHRLPEPDAGDVFFDIEGDRFAHPPGLPRTNPGLGAGFEYLFGVATGRRESGYAYRARWAFGDDGADASSERKAFEQFIDWVMARWEASLERARHEGRDGGMHIYHYNHYEPTALKRLMSTYATREDEVDRLLRGAVFVDLYTVVRQSVRVGAEGYSIKDLEKYYGYERAVDLREEANPSIRMLERALEMGNPGAITDTVRADVEGYNKDDCLSTAYLRDWLEDRRAELISLGNEIPRPQPKDPDPDEEMQEKLEAIRETAAELQASLPADMAEWTNAHHAVRLLVDMLMFFRRELKVDVWEKFRLLKLPEEELIDERTAIVGLQFVSRFQEGKTLPIDTYSYPPQELKIKKGDTLKFAKGDNADKKFGSVVSIDSINRSIEVKKTGAFRDENPDAVFSLDIYGKNLQQAALHDIARDIVERGIDAADGPFRVARRLLLRQGPRALDSIDGDAATTARNLVNDLDGDVLAIQGPPGSGKTYLGAQMICDLVAAGKRVGVTATGHSVISGLLKKTVELACERGLPIRCVHKPKSGSKRRCKDDEALWLETDTKKVVAGVRSNEFQVVGGVSWLWTGNDVRGLDEAFVDVLFVDEAGQMSLAEVLSATVSARNLVLLGDPSQLDQPQQASHPEGTDVSALAHMRGIAQVMPPDRGLFMEHTRRLHPTICDFTSELFYEGKLATLDELKRQDIRGTEPEARIDGAGLYWLPVKHEGNRNESLEESSIVQALVDRLIGAKDSAPAVWTDQEGVEHPVTPKDILVVAPYNAQVTMLQSHLPEDVRVGTVDKFQGKEAPVVIYSFTTSNPADAPRGMDFLYSLNRLNVATSRARCAVVIVASPALLEPECRTPHQMRLANALARYKEMATAIQPQPA